MGETYRASLHLVIAVQAYRYAQGMLRGTSLFSGDVLRLDDPVGPPLDSAINTRASPSVLGTDEVLFGQKPAPVTIELANPRIRLASGPAPGSSGAVDEALSSRFAIAIDSLLSCPFLVTDAAYKAQQGQPAGPGPTGPSPVFTKILSSFPSACPSRAAPTAASASSTTPDLPFKCDDTQVLMVCEHVQRSKTEGSWGLPRMLTLCLQTFTPDTATSDREQLAADFLDQEDEPLHCEILDTVLNIFSIIVGAPAVSSSMKQGLACQLLSTSIFDRLLSLRSARPVGPSRPSKTPFDVKCTALQLLPKLFGSLGASRGQVLRDLSSTSESLFDRLAILLKQAMWGPPETVHEGLWLARLSMTLLNALAHQGQRAVECLLRLDRATTALEDDGLAVPSGSARARKDAKGAKQKPPADRDGTSSRQVKNEPKDSPREAEDEGMWVGARVWVCLRACTKWVL